MKLIVLFLSLVYISACSTKPYIIKKTDIKVTLPQQIFVVNHGWHTGFVIPSDTIFQRLPQLEDRFGSTPYIEFGWGDKDFYQANEITSGLTIQAIFWPTDSVMHTAAVPTSADHYFSNSETQFLCLNPNQYALLVNFIENSFYKNSKNQILPLQNGLYGNSQFYKGDGDYYLMNTCNKWTAKGLNSAGLNISTTFKLTASSVMDYLFEEDEVITNCLKD